ncbi:MAG: hypothetical protein DRP09_19220 [Candidatus Thorarchaeota archaeon]|nr:MAG: hypothetical protein DRP09_19220 [Candidatus Thorarchaeota archaeon]
MSALAMQQANGCASPARAAPCNRAFAGKQSAHANAPLLWSAAGAGRVHALVGRFFHLCNNALFLSQIPIRVVPMHLWLATKPLPFDTPVSVTPLVMM